MRSTQAKKLHNGDEVTVKDTGFVETVCYIEIDGNDVIIFTSEGSDYHHTQVS
jgi:hypothetical protein